MAEYQAEHAGLRYVYDGDPGFGRRRHGKSFAYLDARGRPLKIEKHLSRCRKLAIPPAWESVWICASDDGHIQATGLDARGRKQYRYHEAWRHSRDADKFFNMLAFGSALPKLRREVDAALRKRGLPKEKVVAAVIRLLDRSGLRVGNDAYEHENHTYGLTTIHKEHVRIHGHKIELDFDGKGGKHWHGDIDAPKAVKVIAACEDLPGHRLFKFLGPDGKPHAIGSADVNAWLQEKSGLHITAKDFRTWNACSLFLHEAMQTSGVGGVLHIKPVLKAVADKLGNTPAILKKSYVHPELIDLYRTGCFIEKGWPHDGRKKPIPKGLSEVETLLLRWLEKQYG